MNTIEEGRFHRLKGKLELLIEDYSLAEVTEVLGAIRQEDVETMCSQHHDPDCDICG